MTTKPPVPQRTCVGCKKRYDQSQLVAVTRLKGGEVIVNEPYQQLGRSVYMCKKIECLKKIRDRKGGNALKYGLKMEIPTNIKEDIWKKLEKIIK